MFRFTRRSAALAAGVASLPIGAVTLWATGVVQTITTKVTGLCDAFVAWLNQPLELSHIVAGLGVIGLPLLILLVLFSDG